jgi:hypothetical protein
MKWPALALTVTVLASTLPAAEAFAAEPTDPAPTNVQISWKDETFQFVHVTWEEDAARPNLISVRKPGSTAAAPLRMVAADAPNEIDLPKDSVWMAGVLLEVRVSVGTATGATSPVAVSPAFDTIDAGQPVIQSYQPSGTSTLHVTWKQGTSVFKDTTPGDPLDRELPASYQPAYRIGNAASVPIGQPTPDTAITFTGPNPPYSFLVQSRNEWTNVSSEYVEARPIAFTTSIPSWVVADRNTVIRGTYTGPDYATVTLQARNTPTSPWYAVAGYTFTDNTYQFTVPSRGTRQYRVAISNTKQSPLPKIAWFGGYSAPVTTTTQLKATVSLGTSSVYRGNQPVAAWLYVNPAVTGTAALQRWNGKTWTLVGNVAISGGRGTGYLSATMAGTFTYRYYVPTHTYNGLSVAAAYSPNFVLKVLP